MKEVEVKCTIKDSMLNADYIEVKIATTYEEHDPIILSIEEFKDDFNKVLNEGFLSEPPDMFLKFSKETGKLSFVSYIIEPTQISATALVKS